MMRWAGRLLLIFILSITGILYIMIKRVQDDLTHIPGQLVKRPWRNPHKHVIIFAATKFFGMDITTERFLSKCYSTKGFCRISENQTDLDKADAILFHNADYTSMAVPQPRRLSRPHILWSLESPTNDGFRPGPHVINWTMTFRQDADIWYPYGHFRKLDMNKSVDFDGIWNMKDKSKTATWLASNCFTSNFRSDLIDAMQKAGLKENGHKFTLNGKNSISFPIDRYGKCGMPAPGCEGVDKQSDSCVAQLVRPYKFYISIENSNCVDYVTEKFFEALISRMAVPIVLKREIYKNIGAPADSFIALDDFRNIGDMVEYVNEVAEDKQSYLKYHQWRSSYEVIPEHNDETGFCELCRRLQYDKLFSKSYEDVRKWHADEQCDNDYGKIFLPSIELAVRNEQA
ncbi:unnamed protein product [Cylicocyclus nassatus]|uniref:Fucosyltransferase n=1 Tax=Cylicocyclus nassatus TaxID=53992 RepID=A0AA36DLL0_CYLNA|nr:unnamed protein product [Cylicocyclus nassatus]